MTDQRTILITGVTRGLGRALAEGFIARGHTVVGCGRTAKAIETLRTEYPSPHRFDALDVTDDEAVRAWAESVLASHGPPNLLINNAALINRNAPLWEVPAAEFDACVDVNIKGVANVIRHFVPAMIEHSRAATSARSIAAQAALSSKESGGNEPSSEADELADVPAGVARRLSGMIVNFSSGRGRSAAPEIAPYCATKWAIEGLSQAIAQELPSGMAAVALNPGVIDTDMLRRSWADAAAGHPRPAEWAKSAVPFLLSIGPEQNGKPLTVPQ